MSKNKSLKEKSKKRRKELQKRMEEKGLKIEDLEEALGEKINIGTNLDDIQF